MPPFRGVRCGRAARGRLPSLFPFTLPCLPSPRQDGKSDKNCHFHLDIVSVFQVFSAKNECSPARLALLRRGASGPSLRPGRFVSRSVPRRGNFPLPFCRLSVILRSVILFAAKERSHGQKLFPDPVGPAPPAEPEPARGGRRSRHQPGAAEPLRKRRARARAGRSRCIR